MSKTEEPDLKNQDEEAEVDLLTLATRLWSSKGKMLKWAVCGAIIGLIISISIPREYQTSAKLSPELTDSNKGAGGLGALASMAGINTGTTEALYPQLYPDIVQSIPFLTGLFSVEVTTIDGDTMTVEQYLRNDLRSPWWSMLMALPGKAIAYFSAQDSIPADHKLDNFHLTRREAQMVELLSNRVTASVEDFVDISVTMQDPMVSAVLCDTVVSRLQQYVTDYRTNKARQDLRYAEKINAEAQQEYYDAQKKLADYIDRNQGLATHSARITRDRLENEAQLAFTLYNQTAHRVQTCEIVVQENTPVYVVVDPPTVPISPTGLGKLMMMIIFAFLGFIACAVWILFIKSFVKDVKKQQETDKDEDPVEDED